MRDFATGASPVEVCARTIRTLKQRGARHFYVSNLPLSKADAILEAIVAAI
jgi:hypothetical protein